MLFEETVTTSGSPASAMLDQISIIDADTIYITFDGVTYTCPKVENSKINRYGSSDDTFSDFPFYIYSVLEDGQSFIGTQTAGTYTIKVEIAAN